jgi:hypothetical protein
MGKMSKVQLKCSTKEKLRELHCSTELLPLVEDCGRFPRSLPYNRTRRKPVLVRCAYEGEVT